MSVQTTHIKDCVLLQPNQFADNRGIFSEIFKESWLPSFKSAQSNYSFSKRGVLRGIHRTPYAKLVTCVKGTVYDVCLDLRKDSATYKQHFSICLSEYILNSLYIPAFCGHAFLALEDSILIYQQNQEYNPALDETYCYKNFNINWPTEPFLVSYRDSNICNE